MSLAILGYKHSFDGEARLGSVIQLKQGMFWIKHLYSCIAAFKRKCFGGINRSAASSGNMAEKVWSGYPLRYPLNRLLHFKTWQLVIVFFLRNIIHGSDSVKSAEKEISLWFKPEELVDYKSCAHDWVYEWGGHSSSLLQHGVVCPWTQLFIPLT